MVEFNQCIAFEAWFVICSCDSRSHGEVVVIDVFCLGGLDVAGNVVTVVFIPVALITCMVGLASVLAGGHHLRIWRTESLAAAAATSLIAWLLTLLSMGLAAKEIHTQYGRTKRLVSIPTPHCIFATNLFSSILWFFTQRFESLITFQQGFSFYMYQILTEPWLPCVVCRKHWKRLWSSFPCSNCSTCLQCTLAPSHATDTPTPLATMVSRTLPMEHLRPPQSRRCKPNPGATEFWQSVVSL